ncbi:hypothetical protein SLE2022_341000 [Rubroshorea leprosula]
MDVLNQFSNSSGLVLNLQKSKLFFSANIQSAVANSLSTRCGIPLTSNLGSYLGIPVIHGRHSSKHYEYILEKMQKKLASWKGANLSLAGRKVLVQSVTTSIPAYTMQSILLPNATCDAIDRLNRDFLWGSDSRVRKPHPVSWEVVCFEKKYGGLGLRFAWDNNQAFIAKLGWRILKGDNALWCRVMQAKYLRGRNFMEAGSMVGASFIWRGIVKCRSVLQQGVHWRIGSGEKICFWQDAWVGDAPLISSSNEPPALPSLLVLETINSDRDWNLELLHELVPAKIVEKIRAIPLSRNSQLEDGVFWANSMDGLFTVKSAYQLLQAPRNFAYHSTDSWNWIWKLHCAERIRLFVWLWVRGRVLTNSVHFAHHMAPSPLCPRCDSSNETPIDLLRDCFYAKTVWSLLGFARSEFFTLDSFPWLKIFSTISRAFRQAEVSRAILFLSTIWLIWKDRNALVFRNHRSRPQELCATIWQYAKYTEIAMSSSSLVKSRLPRWVRWMPPMEGWYKLSSDGSFNVTSNSASAGGLIRDFLGNWISGFVVNVGCASIFIAELWGLREGLKLCKSLGIARVVAEMDSLVAVRSIIEKREPDNLSAAILMDIRSLMSEFEECILQHVLREGNVAADFLASLGHSSPPGRSLLDSPPAGLWPILTGD